MAQTYQAKIDKTNGVRYYGGVAKWTPLTIRGMDVGGTPEFLGFLYERVGNILTITHIVTKMPGHMYYQNRVDGSAYRGVSVMIFAVESYMEFDDHIEFEVGMPWDEEFQKPREKK